MSAANSRIEIPFTGADVADLIEGIAPFDELEKEHQAFYVKWIQAGNPIWRLTPPAVPPRHLVCYFVPYDRNTHSFLLANHIKAQQWLPGGGHVEEYEDPKVTAIRECKEELNTLATLSWDTPFFVSRTMHAHEDMSLWYALEGKQGDFFDFTRAEFTDVKWFTLDNLPSEPFESNLIRAMTKLKMLVEGQILKDPF